jgi:ribosomal protein S6
LNTYEAMFLFDTSRAADYPAMEAEVGRLMERAGAELLLCKRWDERKLAYQVYGRKRGCYVLAYFKAPPDKITELEADARLSEMVLRLLVLRADQVSDEIMRAPTPCETATAEREAARRFGAHERESDAADTGEGPPPRRTSPRRTEADETFRISEPEVSTS